MKKRIMLGKTVWFFMFFSFVLAAIVFFISFTLFANRGISIDEAIKAIVVTIILATICFLLDQGLNASIKVQGEKIILNALFKKRQYNKNDIIISYAIQKHQGRGAYTCPCLVVGGWYNNAICYTKRKLVYDSYFLILLDDKKLKTILSWYGEEINLPSKNETEYFSEKKIKAFYEIIERHNYNLQKAKIDE